MTTQEILKHIRNLNEHVRKAAGCFSEGAYMTICFPLTKKKLLTVLYDMKEVQMKKRVRLSFFINTEELADLGADNYERYISDVIDQIKKGEGSQRSKTGA